LLIYNNIFFLTETRTKQFNLAVHILKNNIKIYEQLPSEENIKEIFKFPKNPFIYTELLFFKN
jgi:hypothetical protein